MKTGALIRFACEAGAIIAGAPRDDRERLAEFGSAIGLAFQLADDLLDLTADASQMGKATGKDAAAGKATLVGAARRRLGAAPACGPRRPGASACSSPMASARRLLKAGRDLHRNPRKIEAIRPLHVPDHA